MKGISITTEVGKVAAQPSLADARSGGGEFLSETPPSLRFRIVSGMRWTLWLSVLGAPFSYGTSVLLARTGPEVLGTWGLLMVYVSVVASLFYVGGDAVVIKFVPELAPEKRLAFLVSYFLVVSATLVPWLAAATLWPSKLSYLFGKTVGAPFQVLILYLSPIYIMLSLVVAGLKAMLEMRLAQMLLRILTVGFFLLYGTLFFAFRSLLRNHYTGLIFGIYLALTAVCIIIGLRRLLRLEGWRCDPRSLRFFLPRGFWKYTVSLEQVSAITFFAQRLDLILILNFGGLALLGKYVAVVTFADIIRTVNRFFLDTLLPSLTNLLASGNLAAASQVFSLNLRILFVVNTAATCGFMFLIAPVTTLLGPEYVPLGKLLILMVLFYGLSAPGAAGNALLSSVGKQQRAGWTLIAQLGVFTALFLELWPQWQLLGAVVASGGSVLLSNIVLLAVAKVSTPLRFSFARDYATLACFGLASAGVAWRRPFSFGAGFTGWVATLVVFLLLVCYGVANYRLLANCFLPARPGSSVDGRTLGSCSIPSRGEKSA